MKIVAFSDLHGAMPAAEAMLRQESSADMVIAAGDIGPPAAPVFEVLGQFGCPILYVNGNWDYEYESPPRDRGDFIHLQDRCVHHDRLLFVGYSGCDDQWGDNPLLAALVEEVRGRHAPILEQLLDAGARWGADSRPVDAIVRTPAFNRYRRALARVTTHVAAINLADVRSRALTTGHDPRRIVFVSHERVFRLHETWPGLGLHLFGHRHGFRASAQRGTTFVNVSALDPRARCTPGYTVIETTSSAGYEVSFRPLERRARLITDSMRFVMRHRRPPTLPLTHRHVPGLVDPL